MLSKRFAIDLGTANSLVYEVGRGIVLNEPTVVAVTLDDNKVVAVGNAAKEMLGRTPVNIKASRPMRDGVIADYIITEAMLRYFINMASGSARLFKPEAMISVPAGVTSVESRAVLDAAFSAGAKTAYLIPEPLAAAIGAKIPISEPSGNMIVNTGGGTTEVAIISLGGIVVQASARVAGNRIDGEITTYLRRQYDLLVGERTAEEVKLGVGSALPASPNASQGGPLKKELTMEIKGRDSISGLPRMIRLSSGEITEAIQPVLIEIVATIKQVLEKTPPELASDVIDRGMVLSGGTALLRNFDRFVTRETGVPAHVVNDPLLCTVTGVGIALENLDVFRKSITKR
jgi:rod shape-determining protein MreB